MMPAIKENEEIQNESDEASYSHTLPHVPLSL